VQCCGSQSPELASSQKVSELSPPPVSCCPAAGADALAPLAESCTARKVAFQLKTSEMWKGPLKHSFSQVSCPSALNCAVPWYVTS